MKSVYDAKCFYFSFNDAKWFDGEAAERKKFKNPPLEGIKFYGLSSWIIFSHTLKTNHAQHKACHLERHPYFTIAQLKMHPFMKPNVF